MASMTPLDAHVNRFGFTEVYKPGPANVDIVFVHGLNGDPQRTWTSEETSVFWPAQLLPPILEEEKVRIMVYGYDADVTSFTDGVSRDKIHNHAEHLVAELAANRRIRKATERPIIFVAHSLGGLVVKRALIYSSEIRGPKTEHLRSIFVSTYGILFLGTPHKGANIAKWGSRLERICGAVLPKKVFDSQSHLIDALKTNNETLQNIDRQFVQIMSRYHIYFFHEAKPTDFKGTLEFVVDEESASPTVQDVERAGIQADHSHMCKFKNDTAPGFDLVAEGIQRYADDAPSTIKSRWEAEIEERFVRGRAELAETAKLYPDTAKGTPHTESTNTSAGNSTTNLFIKPSPVLSDPNVAAGAVGIEVPPKSAEPYFIVPPGFRANTFFVGMEKELQELDRRLFDRRRRDGTACVLIHGQPGGGKSHLARQYVNKNRKKFQGGIFWIIAKFREERLQAYWNIHQKVVARESPELCASVNGNENTFVESVKTWFESRQEWLIVFDGVVVDKDADATELQSFVPDSRNSSIIYISRAKNLESKQRLLRPFPIKVSPLKEEDARKLLFKELHIRKPTEAETKNATELVRKIGGLPLAIDAISHRLADTHEPLAKYNMKSYSADPKMGGTYNKILDDLQRLGHIEAWNLIHILCFYGQHIPFEMVHLGLKSLRSYPVEVKSCEDGGKADIDTTFGILMRYALIERNEPDDKASMSSSRDSLVDPEPIDMLKMHSVVQKFCCDSLNAQRLLPTWLGYAARLFSYSFKQADIKIKQRPEPGRISDYRYYLVHGQRLWDHSQAYESRNQRLASVREVLSPVLAEINDEIQFREPSSSQESVNRGIFQISIFDRTSSSSESGPSLHEARTPDHRPTPLPMPNQNLYGMDLDKPSIDSPGSFRTLSPIEPRIVANSPSVKMPPYYQDPGYESDREGLYQSQMMQKNPSDLTARPPSSKENHRAGWQVVPPTKKPRKGRDLGSFRPTPAKAQVNRMPAIGSVARPAQERGERLRPSVDAFASLREVNHRSPPRSSQGGVSFWQRGPSPKQQPLKPTYAGIAARKPLQPGPRPGASEPLTSSNVMERATSEESLRGRQGNADQSPLATEFFPHRGSAGSIPQQSSNFTTRPLGESHIDDSSHSSRDQQYILPPAGSFLSDPSRPRYMTENLNPSHSSSPTRGRNPAPLPLDRDIQVTPTARPFLFDFESPRHSPPYPSTRPPSRSPRSQPHVPYQSGITSSTSNSPFPTGYYSQPMSRHESHNSHNSVAETEPLHQHHPNASFSPPPPPVPPFASPRDRDGRPLPKSPKTTDYASATHEISGAGGWAYPSSVSPPVMARPMYSDAVAGGGMSRSSSGPGIAVEGGLGIVQVDGVVQFGEHDPVRVEDARRRAWEWEEQLKRQRADRDWRAERADGIDRDGGERDGERGRRGEWESEGGRGRARLREQERKGQGEGSGSGSRSLRPYPNVNLIPTFTDPVKMSDLL